MFKNPIEYIRHIEEECTLQIKKLQSKVKSPDQLKSGLFAILYLISWAYSPHFISTKSIFTSLQILISKYR